jgi:hypothetical protein
MPHISDISELIRTIKSLTHAHHSHAHAGLTSKHKSPTYMMSSAKSLKKSSNHRHSSLAEAEHARAEIAADHCPSQGPSVHSLWPVLALLAVSE